MSDLFKMLENAGRLNRQQNQTWTPQERERLQMYQFGEEDRNFEERFGEANALGRTRVALPFDYIRLLTAQITSQMFGGSSRYEQDIRRWYVALTEARARKNKSSMRGHNVKGVVSALLYLHIRMVENKAPSIQAIIEAANKVRSEHKLKLDTTTFGRSKTMVLKYLATEFRYSKDAIGHIQDHIDKIGNELGLGFKERKTIKNKLFYLPQRHLTGTSPFPHTVARVLMYVIYKQSNKDRNEELKKSLKITKTDEKKWVPEFVRELSAYNLIV